MGITGSNFVAGFSFSIAKDKKMQTNSVATCSSVLSAHSAVFGHVDWTFRSSAGGHSCKRVSFQPAFQFLYSYETIHVQANIGFQTEGDSTVFSSWVQSVTATGFDACLSRSGHSGPRLLSIEWVAYVSVKRTSLVELSGPFQDAVLQFDDFTTGRRTSQTKYSPPLS
eukprot:m.170592 g.170592  ORF g.170592 m.170592 type:complete len:168 (+) comp39044_c0_seq9:34-537(+)